MTKELIILALILLVIYLYYQSKKVETKPELIGDEFGGDSDWETQNAQLIRSLEIDLEKTQTELTTAQQEITALKSQVSESSETAELEAERDEAIRDKRTLEQEVLATQNRLRHKSQETEAKAKQIELLKKEKSQSEIALNKTITELRKEQKKLQEKYSKQGKLLDEEQTDNNKLTDNNLLLSQKVEKLERQIQELKKNEQN